jgi:hypothetical protein
MFDSSSVDANIVWVLVRTPVLAAANPNHSSRCRRYWRMARDGRVFGWRLRRSLSGVCGLREGARTGARCPVG